jgi:hypothetical protein
MITQEELVFANAYLSGETAEAAFAQAFPSLATSTDLLMHANMLLSKPAVLRYVQSNKQVLEPLSDDIAVAMVQVTKEIALGQVNIYDKFGVPVTEVGLDNTPTIVTQEVKPSDRLKAAEMILRLEGLFEKDNKQKATKEVKIENMDDEKLRDMLNALRERQKGISHGNFDEAHVVNE